MLTRWAHYEEKNCLNWSRTRWYTEEHNWRRGAAVDSQGWVCVNVMTWLLDWRIHCWWQRCRDEVVLIMRHEIQPLRCVMSCRRQSDWSVSGCTFFNCRPRPRRDQKLEAKSEAEDKAPRPRPRPKVWPRGHFSLEAKVLASRPLWPRGINICVF